MTILFIAPDDLPLPPFKGCGGPERAIYDLALQFIQQGHTVDIICKEGSTLAPDNINSIYYPDENNLDFVLKCLRHHKRRYDIIHLHIFEEDFVREIANVASSLVTSINFYMDEKRARKFDEFESYYLTQSQTQAAYYEQYLSNVVGILQGIRTDHIPFPDRSFADVSESELSLYFQKVIKRKGIEQYLLMLSTISKYKGQLTAIKLAKKLNIPLVLAGEPKDDHADAQETSINYFNEKIKPHFDDELIFYFGRANEVEKYELMKYARTFLFPTGYEDNWWREAFGRVVAESLATGTPVVAYKNGAMEEQVIEGKNGYLFTSFEEAVEKVKRADEIDRFFCSDDARKRLGSERFAKECLNLYQTLTT